MARPKRILVVDDEADVRQVLNLVLSSADYQVELAESGRLALELCQRQLPDVVILDVNMPEMDGWQTLEQIRKRSDVPVVMLTVRHLPEDRVRGLNAGADDYVAKPFNREELLARIRAVMRRSRRDSPTGSSKINVGWIEIDLSRDRATIAGEPVDLSFQSWRLLRALASHLGEQVPPQELIEIVWQGERITDQHRKRLKVEVLKLRRKLKDTRPPQLIHAKYRKGYMLDYRPRE